MNLSDFKKYLELEKHYSVHTSASYIADLIQFQEFIAQHEVDLNAVNYSMIRQWMASLMEASISSRSINRKMSSLKAYYKYLRIQGLLEHNVMSVHKNLKISKKVQVPFSQKEVAQFLELPYDRNAFEEVRDRVIIELLYVTGMRRAELVGLRMTAVNHNEGQIKVLGKRNKERLIPLLSFSKDLIDDYLELRNIIQSKNEEAFFLTSSGAPIYPSLVYRVVTNYFKRVSVKTKVSPHVLRHTFATHLLDKGADLNAVKELLGHSSLASTQVYTHTSMQALKSVHGKAHPRNKQS